MSDLIFLDAEFDSYASFEVALKQYCQQAAVNGVPLKFTKQSTKLKSDTFKSETLNQTTIDKFVYQNQRMVCVHRKKAGTTKDDDTVNCGGRITFRYDKARKMIVVSSFEGQHTNHPNQSVAMPKQGVSPRTKQLNAIFNVIKKLPDDALGPVQEACEAILEKWNDDNGGVSILIKAIDKDEIDANHVDTLLRQTGKLANNTLEKCAEILKYPCK